MAPKKQGPLLKLRRDKPVKLGKLARKEEKWFFLFISPWLVGLGVFWIGPILFSLFMSFTEWSIFNPPNWVGLQNYVNLFHDPLFYTSLVNTFYYTAGTVFVGTVVAFLAALLLNQKLRGITVFRTIFYLPAIISPVAMAILFTWMYNPEFGILNYLLSCIGIRGPKWLFSEYWAMPALILMSLWYIGTNMILFLAGLQNIPLQLYETARIDGGNWWHLFRHITIPMISSTTFLVAIISVIYSFQLFTQVYIMTNGGPGYTTMVYILYLYNNAFQWWKMGYASALGWILFFVLLAFTLTQFRLSRFWVFYRAGK